MNKFLFALLLVFFNFAFAGVFGFSWSIFDPLLALVVIYTFINSMDTRDYLFFALYCGFLKDIFSLDAFGIAMLSYSLCALLAAFASRAVYRQNWIFVFPIVFFSSLINAHAFVLFRSLIAPAGHLNFSGLFFARSLIESLGTALFAYPIYIFSKKCVLDFTG